MIPPSDSILHHSHKLSEAATNVEQNSVRPTPPPPYSTAAQHNAVHEDTDSDLAGDEDHPAPIAIHVDASINIRGDGNSIVLSAPAAESASPTPPTPSAPTVSATAHAAQQQRRQARIADMTTSILAALHRTGLLNAARASTPVEIHIATGIKIEGSRNVICSGSAANRAVVGKRHASGDGTTWKR